MHALFEGFTGCDVIVDAVQRRRSVRHFLPDPVPIETIEWLVRRSLWAPSPHNSQPWRFTLVHSPERKQRLADAMAARLGAELSEHGVAAEERERQIERSRTRILAAPSLLLCSLSSNGLRDYPDARRNRLEWEMAVQSVGSALQTLFLTAHAVGLGSCWMAAPMYCPDEVRSALTLPVTYEPQALVLLGYAEKPGRARVRRSLGEVFDIR